MGAFLSSPLERSSAPKCNASTAEVGGRRPYQRRSRRWDHSNRINAGCPPDTIFLENRWVYSSTKGYTELFRDRTECELLRIPIRLAPRHTVCRGRVVEVYRTPHCALPQA